MLPNARVMIHQPLGGARGPATDIKIELDEMIRTQQQLYQILAHHTGKSLDQITADCDRNNWMDAEQTVAYGLGDKNPASDVGFAVAAVHQRRGLTTERDK